MSENHAAVAGYQPGFVKPDPIADLAAFDLLPRSVRRALDDAPFAISAVAALDVYRTLGRRKALSEITASARDYLEACEKQTGVPRPKKPLGVGRKRARC